MPSSNIAQRFSEALLHLFRKHMDVAEAAIAARDTRPTYAAEWSGGADRLACEATSAHRASGRR